ncbi:hypothetical protein PENTCL1PPCAC_12752, partial [Pristionchus entomophagus]
FRGHVPAPQPRKKCIEHHTFNEETQSCEWNKEPKYCGQLITNDGRRKLLEIPNWPNRKKYDVDHWTNETKRAKNFHVTVSIFIITEIIVRQHCWATLLFGNRFQQSTLETVRYGRHQVKSYWNGLVNSENEGTHRV